jgi:hypothetical protein
MTDSDESDGAQQVPCQDPGLGQFGFWLGDWDVTWGEGERGQNHIERILGGCIVMERFDGRPGTPLQGISVSSYDPAGDQWRQTWVDNQGGYLDFAGGWQGDRMVLSRRAAGGAGEILQRMVWYDIGPDAMEWNWERSDDDGQTWSVLWNLHYRRMSSR